MHCGGLRLGFKWDIEAGDGHSYSVRECKRDGGRDSAALLAKIKVRESGKWVGNPLGSMDSKYIDLP